MRLDPESTCMTPTVGKLHTHTHTHAHTHTCTRTHAHTYAHTCRHMHAHARTCAHKCFLSLSFLSHLIFLLRRGRQRQRKRERERESAVMMNDERKKGKEGEISNSVLILHWSLLFNITQEHRRVRLNQAYIFLLYVKLWIFDACRKILWP